MKFPKRTLISLSVFAVAIVVILAGNVLLHPSRQLQVSPASPLALDENKAAQHLSGAIKFQTIARPENAAQFVALHAYLAQTFPLLHARLKLEELPDHSLLYTWAGRDAKAPPIAWLAHQDVVPVASGTEQAWQAPPFGGEIRDGYVWGRGAWDNKGNLIAQMEAIEMALAQGFQPAQTLYLFAGADEEVAGRGAQAAVAMLKERGVKLDYVLDEGLVITHGILTMVAQPVALVGIAEKGYATYRLEVAGVPGHSSMPPPQSSIGVLSIALAKLEERKMPAAIDGVARQMFDTLAPEMQLAPRVLLSNLWLSAPLVRRQLEKAPSTNAILRTTTALTLVKAGEVENMLPGNAHASVNFRLLPGDSSAQVGEFIRKTVADDAVKVTIAPGASEASPIAATDASAYQAINRSIRQVFPDVVVAPGLMVGATDARHFAPLAANIYRFSPVHASSADLARLHGNNERFGVKNLAEAIHFYRQLLDNSAASGKQ